jgi:hypothetical protein
MNPTEKLGEQAQIVGGARLSGIILSPKIL